MLDLRYVYEESGCGQGITRHAPAVRSRSAPNAFWISCAGSGLLNGKRKTKAHNQERWYQHEFILLHTTGTIDRITV
jgi:hypothetical protein